MGKQKSKGKDIQMRVFRFDPEISDTSHYDEINIPFSKGLTVLDALIYVYENIDSSLSFRWSCKNVQCGTCGVLVNGEAVLACERRLIEGETVAVDPFPLPLVKDLVSDFSHIEDKKLRIFEEPTQSNRPEKLHPEEIKPLISLHKCLDCHICDIVCPVNYGKDRIEPDSLLPSALVQLASNIFDKREGQDRKYSAYSKRLYDCLTCGECVNSCPVDIDIINDSIEKLRQNFMVTDGDPYRKLFNPKDWLEKWIELKGQPFLQEVKEEYTVKKPGGRIGFFVGCYMNRRQQSLASSTIKALNTANLDVIIPKDQVCCGQPLMRLGMLKEAKELLLKNISIFENAGVSEIVTACPDCTFAFSEDYAKVFGDSEEKPNLKILNLIDILPPVKEKGKGPFACHNPCYLSKQGMSLSQGLISKGIDIEEVIEDCCGAGGGVYFTNAELSKKIGKRTAEKFASDKIVCGCPFCLEQLGDVTSKEKKVMHYIELWD